MRQAAGAIATTRRLAARLTAVPAVASAPDDATNRMMYAIAGAALLALAVLGAVTMARATHRMLP